MSGKPRQEGEEKMKAIDLLIATINLITALILWQTAKRNKRRD